MTRLAILVCAFGSLTTSEARADLRPFTAIYDGGVSKVFRHGRLMTVDGARFHFVRDDFTAKDVDLSVSFKTIAGKTDRAAGLVFRYADRDNFYVVRANALEGNVVAYKTEHGKRSNIGVKGHGGAYGVSIDVPHARWNTLRVIVKGTSIEVFLDHRKLFEVEDGTFQQAGKIGMWTKADSVTQFDDLRVKSLDPP